MACKPDELALDADNFCGAVLGNFAHEMPAALAAALRQTLNRLDTITGELWTEEAVCGHPGWQAIRGSAGVALAWLDRWRKGESSTPDGS